LAKKLPPIEVAKVKGKVVSANNKRLKAHKIAKVPVETVPASKKELRNIKKREQKWKK